MESVWVQVTDRSIPFMPRTEVIDVRSGAHLGHVFNGEPDIARKFCTAFTCSAVWQPEGKQGSETTHAWLNAILLTHIIACHSCLPALL